MYCSNCGASNPEGKEACASCGASLAAAYPAAFPGQPTPQATHVIRAMSVGDIFDETIRLYRQNFRTFVGIVAILQVPLVVLQMIQLAIVGPAFSGFPSVAGGQPQFGPIIFWIASALSLGLISFIAYLVNQAAMSSAISERYLGHRITVGRSYRVALGCFWRMLGATLLSGIALALLTMTIVGIPFAIFFGIRWSLVVPAITLEGKGVRKGLSRSSGLVKGSWWRVVVVLLIASIAMYLVAAIPGGIVGLVILGVGATISPGSTSALTVINSGIGGIFGILAAPLVPTAITLLYYDLRIRKEGFDLQVLADSLSHGQRSAAEGQL